MAHAWALSLCWQQAGVRETIQLLWKRVAYACRYGKGVGLAEALGLDAEALSGFLDALGEIVEEENRANTV